MLRKIKESFFFCSQHCFSFLIHLFFSLIQLKSISVACFLTRSLAHHVHDTYIDSSKWFAFEIVSNWFSHLIRLSHQSILENNDKLASFLVFIFINHRYIYHEFFFEVLSFFWFIKKTLYKICIEIYFK